MKTIYQLHQKYISEYLENALSLQKKLETCNEFSNGNTINISIISFQ